MTSKWLRMRLAKMPPPCAGILLSIGLHLSFLAVLAFWILSPGVGGSAVCVEAVNGSIDELVTIGPPTLAVLQETELDSEPLIDHELSLDFEVNTQLPARPSVMETSLVSAITSSTSGSVLPATSPQGTHTGAEFFGAYAVGLRFVYVIDSSTSMTGQRWIYACNKLIESLTRLAPDQEFFIISFDLRPGYLFSRRPTEISFYRRSESIIAKVRSWLGNRRWGRGTRPAQAMLDGLSMQPDAIFLLSDGELQDDTVIQLLKHNRATLDKPQIPIHTIHLFSAEGRNTLQTIAQTNSGTFTPVFGR